MKDGPDRGGKGDNHAKLAFQAKGDEVRVWLEKNAPSNTFTVCGDRQWQYHSVHPTTRLNEFSVAAAIDAQAGGSPGEDKDHHRVHRVKGGFLWVTVREKAIVFQHNEVHGKVVYEHSTKAD
jgi:alkaline phosphatase D